MADSSARRTEIVELLIGRGDIVGTTEILDAARTLSRDEKIVLVQALWDSIAETESPEPDDALKAELDRRIAEDDANPGTGLAWDDVKRQILSRS